MFAGIGSGSTANSLFYHFIRKILCIMNNLLLDIALSQFGVTEAPGAADNPVIMSMARDCGFRDYLHDDISWCSLFANWVALKAGYQRSWSLMARSWLKVGLETSTFAEADIVVLWRGEPAGLLGHVGFPIAQRNGLIYILGGNQGDQVSIEGFDPARVLGFRQLSPI